jgi:hypothetical protein
MVEEKVSKVKSGVSYLIITLIILSTAFTGSIFTNKITLAQQSPSPNNMTSTSTDDVSVNSTSNNSIDTFRAKGIVSSLASGVLVGNASTTDIEMWVLGGYWGLNVVNGNLTNFNVDIKMTKIDGSDSHHHSIEQIKKASGNYTIVKTESGNLIIGDDQKIVLDGNSTAISGFADITTDGKVTWRDVPVSFTIISGNILNLVIDPVKTDYHFKGLPVYGTVSSIISETGKELLTTTFVR